MTSGLISFLLEANTPNKEILPWLPQRYSTPLGSRFTLHVSVDASNSKGASFPATNYFPYSSPVGGRAPCRDIGAVILDARFTITSP